jgi:hypothetical protein
MAAKKVSSRTCAIRNGRKYGRMLARSASCGKYGVKDAHKWYEHEAFNETLKDCGNHWAFRDAMVAAFKVAYAARCRGKRR